MRDELRLSHLILLAESLRIAVMANLSFGLCKCEHSTISIYNYAAFNITNMATLIDRQLQQAGSGLQFL